MFDRLPPELLELVMEEVRERPDRENLAYSCNSIYQVMKQFLWQHLELETGYLYKKKNILKNKHLIKDLRLRFHRNDTQNLSDLLRMIFDGKSVNLSDLFLEGDIPDDIFSLLMSKSMQLRRLDIHIYTEGFPWDQKDLLFPSTLKTLNIVESSVTDTFLESIINANVETLEDLDISQCDALTPKGYLPISNLVHLKCLTLIEDIPNRTLDISFISRLKSLEYLNILRLQIVEDSHIGIWKCVPNLKELRLRHVDGINDIGDISRLQNLRYFVLTSMEDDSKSFAENITSLKNLRTLDINSSLYSQYRCTNFDILSGFKDMNSLRKIKMWCYPRDISLFYKIITKLCEVERSSRWNEEILPKWSVAIQNNECVLRRICTVCKHCQ